MISKNKLFVVVVILVGITAFAGMMAFIGQGNVRHVEIFWQERVEQTVSFEDVDG